jgi:flagellar basal body-associated protein FliL
MMPWSGKLKAVEEWASVNPERERLLVILIIAAFGVLTVIGVGAVALVS